MMSLTEACAEIFFAYRSLPLFQKLLDDSGISAGDVNEDSFHLVPMTTKADYRRGFPAKAVNQSEWDPELVFTSRSSGTTGERLITVVHRHLLAERMVTTVRMNPLVERQVLGRENKRVARFAAPNCSDIECASPFTAMEDRNLPDGTLVLPVAHDLLATPPAIVDQIISELSGYEPAWLYVDPTHLAFLTGRLAECGVDRLPGKAIVVTYSMYTQPAVRALAAVAEAVPVVEVISMSEFGWMGIQCPNGAQHLNTECFHFEVLRGGRPASEGELGELVVTSIGDRLSPHIRYRTGDLVEIRAPQCPCGLPGPIVRHHGRWSACLRSSGGASVTPRQVDDALADITELSFYRVDQPEPDRLRCRILVRDCDEPKVALLVSERLRELVPSAGDAEVAIVSHIEAERSGKFSYCGGLGPEGGDLS
jgi:phenylacetate-CoA ligase